MAVKGSLLSKSSGGKALGSSTGRKKSKAKTQAEPKPGDYGYRPPVDAAPIGENIEVDQTVRPGAGSDAGEGQTAPPRSGRLNRITPKRKKK